MMVKLIANGHDETQDIDDETLFELRCRKGWNRAETERQLKNRYVFGAMMVHEGHVDGQVHGINHSYPDAIRPVLRVIPRRRGIEKVSGVYLMSLFGVMQILVALKLMFFNPRVPPERDSAVPKSQLVLVGLVL